MATRLPTKNKSERELRAAAERFAADYKTVAALQKALSNLDAHAAALKDPGEFFASHGAKLPEGLTLDAFNHPPRFFPGPDWTPFIIELQNCRTYWVRECDDSEPPTCIFKEETVCFGIRIRPRLFPFPWVSAPK